jgi:hypothetical protein
VAACALGASALVTRRGLLPQVFAHGVAWWFMLGAAMFPSTETKWVVARVLVVTLSMASLGLAWPALGSTSARAELAPRAYRGLFLSGAIAAAAVGVASAIAAGWQAVQVLGGHASGIAGEVWGPTMLAIAYIASAVGVVRMRAWGVLAGIAAAAGSLVCAMPIWRDVPALGLLTACAPGALLAIPLVAARLGIGDRTRTRVATTSFVRVADATAIESACDEETAATDDERAAKLRV